jgi:hydroxyacylglutathione hydrolase
MIVKRFFEPLLAHVSYLIGCASAGKAIIIDPNRDTKRYIRAAAEDNLTIAQVTETHIHADFLSGSRELARRTGAELLLSDEGDADWKYAFANEGRLIRDGDRVDVGKVAIDVRHTPGHTPEHLAFLITDGAVADAPLAAATGDFIFVGDVGRPDLLERAAKLTGTMETSARVLYRSLQRFNHHEEWLQIWPGHGAGSSCGKGISAVPYSTLGYERRFNWAFKVTSEEEFVASVLEGQPDPPTYFATMKRLNKEGPRLLGTPCPPPRLDESELAAVVHRGGLVIDTRPADAHAAGFVPGTLNIPFNSSFVTWAGWLVPYTEDVYLILPEGARSRLDEAVRALSLIGLDRIAGYWDARAVDAMAGSQTLGVIPQFAPVELRGLVHHHRLTVLDVRTDHEWDHGHLPGAMHIPLGQLPSRVSEIPRAGQVVTHCQAGARSAIAASVLRRAGFADVGNLVGGFNAWTDAGLPTEQ